ncbi:MAG TPA: ATP-binding cassette domain-containing protein [Bacteroidales bacterium]|nr:ATP-binding cassette domain-containing protein [Bacteroidales bacterium]
MLEIKNISLRLGDFSLYDISLTVEKGDYLTLLGVSGAGKTVLLEVLAGLVKPAQGEILWNGKNIVHQKIQERPVGLVYQDLSLFPHLRVDQNIAYALRCKKLSGPAISKKVNALATLTGVSHLLHRYPETLSGGESQRVALARTLAADPEILLLDEPLSNLDINLRAELGRLLRSINRSGKTIIHVTHDFSEAASLSNKVAVIENGRLVQAGTVKEVFRHPKTAFVARFSGIKNLFHCTVSNDPDDSGLKIARVNGRKIYFAGTDRCGEGYLTIPGEDILLSETPFETSAVNQFSGVITEAWISGPGMEIIVEAGVEFSVIISRYSFERLKLETGKNVWLTFKASSVRFIPQ